MRLLRQESHVLSKSKAGVEQHLRSVKSHLQTLDSMRRALRTKISTLSQSLHLDAQSFKVRELTLMSHAVHAAEVHGDMMHVTYCRCTMEGGSIPVVV